MKRPVLYILIPLILGIITSHITKIPLLWLIFGFVISAILCLVFLRKNFISHLALYLAVFFLGMACYQNALILPRNHIANFTQDEPRKVFLKGVIIDDPVTVNTPYNLKKTSFILKAEAQGRRGGLNLPYGPDEDSHINWQSSTGLVKVDIYSKKAPSYDFGDGLLLEGLLSRPIALRNPGLFDYSKYLEIRGVYSVFKVKENFYVEKAPSVSRAPLRVPYNIKAISYKFRRGLRETIDSRFDGYYASFLKAIFIGDRTGLGDDIKDDFIKTGTVHVLSISGLHVGLIAGIVLAFFGILRVPRKSNLLITLVFLAFYTFVAGANPPIVRAVLMFFIFVVGYLIERETDLLNSLSAAALLILLWSPRELFDPSFQLSFMSIASIIVICPAIDRFLGIAGNKKTATIPGKIKLYTLKCVSVSIAAWFGTWPVIAVYFNIISPVSIAANLVVIPLLFVLTIFSIIFFALSKMPAVFSATLAGSVFVMEEILFSVNHFLSQLPLASFRVPAPSWVSLAVYYSFLSLMLLSDGNSIKRIKIYKKHILAALLLFLNIFVWLQVYRGFGQNLEITFLDAGQGDSVFLQLPAKINILIDGGPGGEKDRFDSGRSVIAPYLWNKGVNKIDAVVVTHFHEDHLGGIIYILENFNVGCVIDNGAFAGDNKIYDEYIRLIKQKNIRRIIVGEGDAIEADRGIKFFVLNPVKSGNLSDSNDNSIVLKLVYKNFSCLFSGDIKEKAMERLSSYGKFLKSDVIKIPHHGGSVENYAAAKYFFEAVSPAICIISVGKQNRYGAPSQKMVDIINIIKSTSYETKSNGAIKLTVNSDGYCIKPYIKENN